MRNRFLALALSAVLSAGAVLAPCMTTAAYVAAGELDDTMLESTLMEAGGSGGADGSGAESAPETISEDDVVVVNLPDALSGKLHEYGIDSDELSLPADKAAVLIDQVYSEVDEKTVDETVENLKVLKTVLESPDFQGLFNYEEVRELVLEIMASTVDFACSDRELSVKILVTLGLQDDFAEALVDGLAYSGITGDDIRSLPADKAMDDLQQLTDGLILVLSQGEDLLEGVTSIREDGAEDEQ